MALTRFLYTVGTPRNLDTRYVPDVVIGLWGQIFVKNHGCPFVNSWGGLNEQAAGMKKRQNNEHDIIEMKLEKYVGI